MKSFTPKGLKLRLLRIFLAVALGVGLLAGGIWLLTQTLGQTEPLYEGKSAYYWSQQINTTNIASSNQASLVLNHQIIPRLTKSMFDDTNDSTLRIWLIDELNSLPRVNIYFESADSRRANAAARLGEFGPAAEAAVPALLQALQGNDLAVRAPAAVSLAKINAKPDVVIPLLITYLDDDNLRESAADALGEYGTLAKAAVPKLLVLFTVRDKSLHHAVEKALAKIDADSAANAK